MMTSATRPFVRLPCCTQARCGLFAGTFRSRLPNCSGGHAPFRSLLQILLPLRSHRKNSDVGEKFRGSGSSETSGPVVPSAKWLQTAAVLPYIFLEYRTHSGYINGLPTTGSAAFPTHRTERAAGKSPSPRQHTHHEARD